MLAGANLAVGLLGLWHTRLINQSLIRMTRTSIPLVDTSHEMHDGLSETLILAAGEVIRKHHDPAIQAKADAELDERLRDYEAHVTTEEERQNLADLRAAIATYKELRGQMLTFVAEGKLEEANSLYQGSLREAFLACVRLTDVANDINMKSTEAAFLASQAEYTKTLWQSILALSVVLACCILASHIVKRRVAVPLQSLTETTAQLSSGELEVNVPFSDWPDEIGKLARGLENFRRGLLDAEKQRREHTAATESLNEQRRQELLNFAASLEHAVGNVAELVAQTSEQLADAAGGLTKTAEETQQLSQNVASASEETSANVQGVAAASEQLAQTVDEIARQVHHSRRITEQAVSQASQSNNCVLKLSESAEKIGNIVSLIGSIAAQTNLLALNASIEAGRSGEAGKGFAVVAHEVKALASQTANSAGEIARQIGEMQAATNEAVTSLRDIATTIKELASFTNAIAAAVEEQGATTSEIARNVSDAARATDEMVRSINQVSRGAAETGAASTQVLASAQQLSTKSDELKSEMRSFLSNVRAA